MNINIFERMRLKNYKSTRGKQMALINNALRHSLA